MQKIINFAKIIRRNWKKSTIFFGLLTYGASYGVERYRTFQMMRAYCEQAKVFGEQVSPGVSTKHLTVILNPEANNKKSHIQFEKFAAPLLHLAGYRISLIQTTEEKEAQRLMEIMTNTDAVLVAGGDGTLHEVVTGLMRRPQNEDENLPLGIIPVGRTNTVANYLFGSKSTSQAQLMAEAAMAIIHEGTISLDVMKVKYTDNESPVYAVSSFEQGAFAEVEPKVQKYWYFGILKDKFAYFINSFKDHMLINYLQLQYIAPCSGCARCYVPPKSKNVTNRWWGAFIPRKPDVKAVTVLDYSKVINEECGTEIPVESSLFSNFSVFTSSSDKAEKNTNGSLKIKTYPKDLSLKQFIISGLKHRESKLECSSDVCSMINAREVKIVDSEKESDSKNSEKFCYIDKEKYKMSSCNITLIPKRVKVYA